MPGSYELTKGRKKNTEKRATVCFNRNKGQIVYIFIKELYIKFLH